ncbi:MAG: hypothetical protein H7X71_04380, partial [Chitinophagales bacterium]|nr:hypothetical protein [Chitinophagales bacterium]
MPQSSVTFKDSELVTTKKEIVSEIEQLLEQIKVDSRLSSVHTGEFARKVISLARSIHHSNYEGFGKLQLAYYVCVVENDYKRSLDICDEALKLMKGNFRIMHLPYYHLNKGRAFQFMGEQANAQNEYLHTIRLLEFKDTRTDTEKTWLASSYYNLFILFNREGVEFTQEDYLQNAFRLYSELHDKPGIANCYNSFAVYHYKKLDYKKSIEYLHRAYAFAKEPDAKVYLSIFCSNLGLVYAKLQDENNSNIYFEEAKAINKLIKSNFHTGHTFQQIGEASMSLKCYDKALENYDKAEKIYIKLGVKASLVTIYQFQSDLCIVREDYKKAYAYQKKYADLLKDQFNDEKTFAIAKARNQFELEKKEKETEILKKQNEQIETYAKQLEVSNNQLRQFAHIASHDLKEPLRMVSSYAKLLQRSMGDKLTTDEQEYLGFMLQGTTTMQNLVNDLLTLSNIHYISDKQPVNMNKVMKTVITNLDSIISERQAVITFDELPTVKAEETQMLQLFLNLTSNAIKYNDDKLPEVNITCIKTRNMFEFSVTDNGIGIPAEYR